MHDRKARTDARPLRTAARGAGFRSVERVRVFAVAGRLGAEATGVLHRYPRTVPVSLATATRLAHAGARLSIDPSARSGGIG